MLPKLTVQSLDNVAIENLEATSVGLKMGPPPTATQRVRYLRVYVITRPDHGDLFCVFRSWDEIEAEFDGAELGDSITVTLKNMSQEELDALPDFQGW